MLVFAVLAIFFFSFGLAHVTIQGVSIIVPLPGGESLAAAFLQEMLKDIVPAEVPLLVTGPLTAFVAEMKVALLLAFIGALPFVLFQIIAYIRPALYEREARLLALLAAPAAILFIFGAAFSYFFILPQTFTVLYGYAHELGAAAFISIEEFVGLAAALLFMGGVTFTVPAVMVFLTRFGVVPARFWAAHWRLAAVGFLILSAIITPDGSGVSMILLAAPVSVLYGAGAAVSARVEKKAPAAAGFGN